MSAAGSPQGAQAPSGGSEPREAGSVGAPIFGLVAGEASGDLLGGHLLAAMRARWHQLLKLSWVSLENSRDNVRDEVPTMRARSSMS